jgi:hypothetical protein
MKEKRSANSYTLMLAGITFKQFFDRKHEESNIKHNNIMIFIIK